MVRPWGLRPSKLCLPLTQPESKLHLTVQVVRPETPLPNFRGFEITTVARPDSFTRQPHSRTEISPPNIPKKIIAESQLCCGSQASSWAREVELFWTLLTLSTAAAQKRQLSISLPFF